MARLMTTAKRKAIEFWSELSDHDRWALGDALVLGDLDWMDWLHEPPPKGFWLHVDRLRMDWECDHE